MRPWRAFLSATLVAGISAVAAFAAGSAEASPSIRYGIEDDAWLLYGPGTLDSRLTELDRLGVDIVRFSLRWDQIAQKRPSTARDPDDPAYAWSDDDLLLKGLRRHGIAAVVTLVGTPSWANGGRSANWEPRSATSFANFAFAAARRYSWVHDWSIWNEPNQPAWLRPTSAEV
jgi:beta-glucosidase/6-phospho-beta-glucosidase/beta-galactosidase